jgi:predicted CXXCH cytochrome family protein
MIPTLPHEPNYFPDGQILEEDYVFGSFVQSKMYMNDVQCNDCHNVHSGKLILQGNDLCLQCHRKDTYDTYSHHFHKYPGETGQPVTSVFGDTYAVGDGSSCINCHMPGRYYMGVDYRRDHSFHVPRPDLSEKLGTPNACTYCHSDKSNRWATAYLDEWYGKDRRSHYGTVIASHLEGKPEDFHILKGIVEDDLFPPLMRATALYHLASTFPDSSRSVLTSHFTNIESIIRYTAVNNYTMQSLDDIDRVLPLLNDPTKAVRIDAAMLLSSIPEENIPESSRPTLQRTLAEYVNAMEYSADFAASRHNLGNYYSNTGETGQAITNYIESIRIDDEFFPAKVNLAMMYNRIGENEKAKKVLQNVVENNPDQVQVYYSLGLLLAEMQEYDDALKYLQEAADRMPDLSRAHYNLGQLYAFKGNGQKAAYHLEKAAQLEPENPEFLMALAELYLQQEDFRQAKEIVLRIKEINPSDPTIDQALEFLDSKIQ